MTDSVPVRRQPRLSRRQALALLVSYAGVALAFGHDLQAGGSNIMLGGALVFGSALPMRCTWSAAVNWSRASVRYA